jgi:hypothetical protein
MLNKITPTLHKAEIKLADLLSNGSPYKIIAHGTNYTCGSHYRPYILPELSIGTVCVNDMLSDCRVIHCRYVNLHLDKTTMRVRL